MINWKHKTTNIKPIKLQTDFSGKNLRNDEVMFEMTIIFPSFRTQWGICWEILNDELKTSNYKLKTINNHKQISQARTFEMTMKCLKWWIKKGLHCCNPKVYFISVFVFLNNKYFVLTTLFTLFYFFIFLLSSFF